MIEYVLKRSHKRRTLAIQVKRGQVQVNAPTAVSEQFIAQFVQQKALWIAEKVQQSLLLMQEAEQFQKSYKSGERYDYLGKTYRLKIAVSSRYRIDWPDHHVYENDLHENHLLESHLLENRLLEKRERESQTTQELEQEQELVVSVPSKFMLSEEQLSGYLSKKIPESYRLRAQAVITERVEYYASVMQLTPSKLQFKRYKRRWGSCSAAGVVSFNWLLIMAPLWVIDYVVVHELCHLKEMNHSNKFWRWVACYYPNYADAKHWLQTNGHSLQV
ncbi:M48 family metallopeptidase [Flocculibacter collagenilyticus]|uniref:M48 family metallopeptidase n=1 Tax=Flocculibacter collagenilyticus TaxID=2744479 RepID=UPI0018F34ABB|nr:SprT family zinc-dependent metalloprotease [Flocculibacter collagenilyticus]